MSELIWLRVYPLFTEPGFYQDGEFGIRIENLVKVITAYPENNFKDRKFCTFENLTFVPIQKKMIIAEMLTREEVGPSDFSHLTICLKKKYITRQQFRWLTLIVTIRNVAIKLHRYCRRWVRKRLLTGWWEKLNQLVSLCARKLFFSSLLVQKCISFFELLDL